MRQFFAFLLGVVSGALIGSSIAILAAPSSGEDLRGQLRDRWSRVRDELSEAAGERREELERQLSSMRNPVREIPLEDR
ncbi:MAG: YtxH domain-containing protein [Anaerolineales bacterium]|jgi:gas vesicle protein|nr:YtxH domain-containing protein [Anaerolineales bacterium]MCW5888329.1 YtxH domain-containing protein [Anaerolineales bacterium]